VRLGRVWRGLVRFGMVWSGGARRGKARQRRGGQHHKQMLALTIMREHLHVTNLEEYVANMLDKLGIDYEFQCATRTGFVIDFVLRDKMVAIEVDGYHWHSSKKAKKRDRFKDYQLKREGWAVVRISEKEALNEDTLAQILYLLV